MNRWDAVGDPDLRATLWFVRGQADPPSADDLAAALDLPRSVARWRLERLVALGVLQPVFVRRTGRSGPGAGRPAKTYAVVPETSTLEFPPRRYEQLFRFMIEALPSRGRSARLREIGIAFGRELARAGAVRPVTHPPAAFDRICRTLGKLGFQAAVESVSADRAVVLTPTCPLRSLVVQDQAAREIDRGMWRGLVASTLLGARTAEVRCTTDGCLAADSACRIVIALER